ncbi:hypothetical protein DFP74_0300 [Nocardiopsis sp. Huas11]|nr:hypothetical protein DFP74_0300 [Nocardiopsis sp. Huas11]
MCSVVFRCDLSPTRRSKGQSRRSAIRVCFRLMCPPGSAAQRGRIRWRGCTREKAQRRQRGLGTGPFRSRCLGFIGATQEATSRVRIRWKKGGLVCGERGGRRALPTITPFSLDQVPWTAPARQVQAAGRHVGLGVRSRDQGGRPGLGSGPGDRHPPPHLRRGNFARDAAACTQRARNPGGAWRLSRFGSGNGSSRWGRSWKSTTAETAKAGSRRNPLRCRSTSRLPVRGPGHAKGQSRSSGLR